MHGKARLVAMAVAGLFALATSGVAQDYPAKQPIKIVVGFNPGGGSDVMARVTAEYLQKRLGQAVVVENRPGAASAIAAEYVAHAPADGYTLFVTTAEMSILPAVRPDLSFDYSAFTYLARPFSSTPLVVVGPDSPINSLAELVDAMKANPGKMRFGTPGVGSLNHLGTVALEEATGTDAVHIPYTGASQVYTDLLAGVIDFYTGASLPVPDGLKVLGPAGEKRHPAYPDMQTFGELGLGDVTHEAWWGVVAPPNLPEDIEKRLTDELLAIYQDPEAIEKFKSSIKLLPDENMLVGPAFRDRVISDHARWKEIAERENIVVQQ